MDTRRLGLILLAGGAAGIVIALVWFAAAYDDAMDMAGTFAGDDYAARLMSCLYSSDPICQGATMFSDGPAYSPVLFWIGVVALLAGAAVLFASRSSREAVGAAEGRAASDDILGLLAPARYVRWSYLLALGGSAAGLLVMPLAVVAFAGFVLAVLGLTVYRPRLGTFDVRHLGLICLIFVAAAVLLGATRGTFLFLLTALVQIAAFYVGFNSYRHGRTIDTQNLKQEVLLALRPGGQPVSAAGTTNPNPMETSHDR